MSDFQVEDKNNYGIANNRLQRESASQKGMLGFLMKRGIVKSEDIGNYVLIGVAIFFFIMSYLAFVIL